jgi:hypothetical protein
VLINTTKSWAVLIGTASHTPNSDLEDLPAVQNNLRDLAAALADPDILGLPEGHILTLLDPSETRVVGNAIRDAGEKASGSLLIYYAGHGIPDEYGQLFLALSGTRTQDLPHDALPFQWMARDIRRGDADTRILILDCCYAGLSQHPTMSGADLIGEQSTITGTWAYENTADEAWARQALDLYQGGRLQVQAFNAEGDLGPSLGNLSALWPRARRPDDPQHPHCRFAGGSWPVGGPDPARRSCGSRYPGRRRGRLWLRAHPSWCA